MAATPKRARNVEAVLIGQAWTLATVMAALPAVDRDFAPISDVRGSAAYRSQAAKNLLVKYFHETQRPPSGTRLIGRDAAFGGGIDARAQDQTGEGRHRRRRARPPAA